MPQGFHVAR